MINKTDLQNATIASYYWFMYTALHKLSATFPKLNVYFHQELNCHLGDNRFQEVENELRYKISDMILNFATNYNLIVIMRKYDDPFLEPLEHKTKDSVSTLIELTLRFRDKSSNEITEVSEYIKYLISEIEMLRKSNLNFSYRTPMLNKDAAKAVVRVLPELAGKLGLSAIRVPIVTGSMVYVTALLEKPINKDEINNTMKLASETYLKDILEYSQKELVSTDIIQNPHSCIVDGGLTEVMGNTVKLVLWYDNEWGYANRLVETVKLI